MEWLAGGLSLDIILQVQAQSQKRLLNTVARWGEMIKFSHSIFALPFALMATFLAARTSFLHGDSAQVWPHPIQLGLIVVCMVAARSVAMTFNRIVDAAIDARNPRTAIRAIPAGVVTKWQAGVFLAIAAGVFEISCTGFYLFAGNSWPLMLSLPVLGYLCLYSYAKRLTRWTHFILGSAIALSPPAAWLAIHPRSLGLPALLLMASVTFWIGGFDIIYACQDIDVDRREGLFSLPSRLGPAAALWVARIAHVLTVIFLVFLIPAAHLGWIYIIGVVLVVGLLLVEHALVRADDFSHVNMAFFTINGVVSLLLGTLAIADCLLRPGR